VTFGIDVNILLYASDARNPMNPKATEFLARCSANREVFCVAWVTLMSYLRMSTHPAMLSPVAPSCSITA